MSLRTLPTDTARSSRQNSRSVQRYDGIFDGYNDVGGYSQAFDEMFDAQGNVRGPYKGIFTELAVVQYGFTVVSSKNCFNIHPYTVDFT